MRPTPPARETFRSSFALSPVDQTAEPNTFRGMASVYHTLIDAWMPTRILPGAFRRTLSDPAAVARIKILYQHDEHRPIGVPTQLLDTATGLEVLGRISETTDGKDALILLRDGVITELSIGFEPLEQIFVKHPVTGIEERHILDLHLHEFSLVTFAANRDAKVLSVQQAQQLVCEAHARLTAHSEAHKGKGLTPKDKALLEASLAALQASTSALALLAGAEPTTEPDPAVVPETPAPVAVAAPAPETPAAVVDATPAAPLFDPAAALREIGLSALEAGVLDA